MGNLLSSSAVFRVILSSIFLTVGFPAVATLSISPETAYQIADKIWKNECAGSVEGLTCWNKGENFASLGIGHFIWYPSGKKEPFQESFPELLAFLKNQGIAPPSFLKNVQSCPWNNRESFYADINGPEMTVLREFLYATRDQQAIFIALRLENTLPAIIKDLSDTDKQKIMQNFSLLEKNPQGLYALIDYINFKGAGAASSESYQGKKWGLLQVLQGMPFPSKDILADFAASAKEVLKQRVKNAPSERNEERWLKGWLNRIDTYQRPGVS